MSPYILILIWIGFMALLSGKLRVVKEETVCGEQMPRYIWLFAFIAFLPIIWMAGTRGYVGDTYAYIRDFSIMPDTWRGLPYYLAGQTKDTGFYLFSALIKLVIGNQKVVYLTIIATIQGICVLSVFRKYSYNYVCSVFLFLASTDYISWMFNGVRQFLAVTIVFAATTLMLKKKYVALLFVILLAAAFHQSALIMIPLVLIAQGKAWNKRTLIFIALAILSVLFVNQFTNLLDTMLSDTQYSNVVSDYTAWNDDGTNPLRVAVYSVPAVLSFILRKKIEETDNLLINFCTNMSILSMGLYLVSMVTSGIFIGRLPIYVSLYGYILLPWELDHLVTAPSRKFAYAGMIVAYLGFYYIGIRPML